MTVVRSRLAALAVLRQVLDKQRPLDEVLGGAVGDLEPRDRAFVHSLVAATLRHLGCLDALLDRCLDRPLPAKARPVRHVLRLGAAQLLVLEMPAHAAVTTAVDLCVAAKQAGHKALVNAILRRLDREGRAWWQSLDAPRRNTPDWLWSAWSTGYGEAKARAIATAHLHPAPLDLTLRDPSEAAPWAERLGATVLPTGSLRLPADHASVPELPGFAEGAWWVQDAAAALPATLLRVQPGQRVADLCAAPGGKTLQLAAMGADVVALDRSEGRLGRVRDNLSRAGLSATVVAADARTWTPEGGPFDAVLLDAPCSATGTLRRHPDALWLKTPGAVTGLAETQAVLLDAARDLVRPGGTLLYCVCSLQPEEGAAVVEVALTRHSDLARDPIAPEEVGGLPDLITPAGDLRTLPCHLGEAGGMDGFYAARLTRSA
ncbi:methyltransferase domain-containing protein [Roseospira marina]|uniref:Methyltransferase domain-containing protein n=1 Tax=Roseospira marina TaxID=140057 RepID=A0A5M6IHN2_9PROT|nr:transcription antitermination factor NusB [Roseospira marina]KAA5607457.1 methyltransferase domain-containing protein [Roseospira marina]MBB4312363.1 16S rRNA (cytosine967-C5)-methyltransferase [Roseospira marina]MBB5085621.1 16S rRNA (cytosine967-C5)-methyltransferase [Roseospira marina]